MARIVDMGWPFLVYSSVSHEGMAKRFDKERVRHREAKLPEKCAAQGVVHEF